MVSENEYEEATLEDEIMDPCVLKDHNYFNTGLTRSTNGKPEELNEGMSGEANALTCTFCFVKLDKFIDLINHIKYNHLSAPEMNQYNNNDLSTFTNENDIVNNVNQADDKAKPVLKKLKKAHYRKCFVPGCESTSAKFPKKIFLCVPSVLEKREQWFKAVNREYINTYSPFAKFFCCEDHFDLKNDAKNWLKYKMMGPRPLRIRDGALPRFFINKSTERSTDYNQAMTQLSLLKNITNEELDIEFVDLYQKSNNSVISVSDLLTMPDDKLKFHIKNQESDRSDDIDWCINDIECNEQKQREQDDNDSNEPKTVDDENVNTLKEDIDSKIRTENQEILCDNNNQPKESKEKSDLPTQTDKNNLLEPIKDMLYCDDCPSSFSTEEDMLQHTRVWHGTTNRRKPPSSTTNDSVHHLLNLINVGTEDVNLMIESDVFEKFEHFQRENAVQSNTADDLDALTPEDNKLLSVSKQRHFCTICKRDYNYNHFKSHLREVHSETEYSCTICGSNFKCERYMRRHILHKHQNKNPRKVKKLCLCPECPKTFKNSDCLSHHVRNCHGDKVECEICHSKLKSISYLKSHMRRVHYNDGKKHRCRICFKEFKSPRQVKIHMINLHPETLHPCPHCIRLFCSTVQLKIHLKRCQSQPDVNVEEDSKTGDELSEKTKISDDDLLVID